MQPLVYQSIELNEHGIAEKHPGGTRAVFVPKEKVERIAVEHGFATERPIATLVGAALFFGIAGYLGLPSLFGAGGLSKSYARVVLMAALSLALGIMFLVSLLWRGTYLRVETSSGVRKLRIQGQVDAPALRAVLLEASARFGYAVDQ